jgi:hypothetical protein
MGATTFMCKECGRDAEDTIAPWCRHGNPELVATRMVPEWFAKQEPAITTPLQREHRGGF